MNSTMTYETLYNNMVKKFTVGKDEKDYKLGEYMLMKARAKKETAMVAASEKNNALPVVRAKNNAGTAIAAAFSYVNDKLTVKEAPVRDRTMRSFPLRTSLTAFGSALVVCGLVVCCGVFGFKAASPETDNIVSASETPETVEQTEDIGYSVENR